MYVGDLTWLRGGRTKDVVSPYEDSTELQDQLRAPHQHHSSRRPASTEPLFQGLIWFL